MLKQPKQSPSTGESTKAQEKQAPMRSDVAEKPDVSRRSGAEATPQRRSKGPKSGGMGPKQ